MAENWSRPRAGCKLAPHMAPRTLPKPIPGWWLQAALDHVGWAQVDLADELENSPVIINRWIHDKSAKGGMTRVQWYAALCAMDLPKTWRPKEARGSKADD